MKKGGETYLILDELALREIAVQGAERVGAVVAIVVAQHLLDRLCRVRRMI